MAEEAQEEEDDRTGAKTRANRLKYTFVFAGAKCVNAGENLFWLHMMTGNASKVRYDGGGKTSDPYDTKMAAYSLRGSQITFFFPLTFRHNERRTFTRERSIRNVRGQNPCY